MCELCICDPVEYEFLPGIEMFYTRKDGYNTKVGEIILSTSNGYPKMQFEKKHFDAIIDASSDNEREEAWDELDEWLYYNFKCDPEFGYELVTKAINVGWDPKKYLTHRTFRLWLADRIVHTLVFEKPLEPFYNSESEGKEKNI